MIAVGEQTAAVMSSGAPHVVERYPDGSVCREQWWARGRLHREDGPAWVEYHSDATLGSRQWWCRGRLHRIEGPAVVVYDGDGQVCDQYWYVHGRELTSQQAANLTQAVDPLTPVSRLRVLARSKNDAIRRAAIVNPMYPQELRFLAQLEHPEWFTT